MNMYSIRDKKAGIFIGPFFVRHEIDAIRRCLGAMSDSASLLTQYPEDYDLWCLGKFNDENGDFQSEIKLITPFSVLSASLKKGGQNVAA